MPEFKIANRWIGENHPPLVIAEIGINHEGSLELAKTMVKTAVDAGAEVIKHQTHVVKDEMSKAAKDVIPGNADVSIYEIMERCALNEEDERALQHYTESLGALFISTPFSRAAADRLADMNIPAFKIGSGECNNYPLIEHVARFGKPIILSTGMNTLESIGKAVKIFEQYQVPYALLHCTNVYPTPPELVRLGAMTEMAAAFPNAVVGLSDHTTSNFACLGAVALGASILERHYTDRMDRPGPDIVCSMDPTALQELITGANTIALCRGGSKGPVSEEQPTIDFAYASVVTTKPIQANEVFTADNLWVKRPGTGAILAEHYNTILGKKATQPIESDTMLAWEDIHD